MPPKEKLPDEVVADFEQWVTIGRARPAGRQTADGRRATSTSRRAGSSGRSSRRRQSPRPAVKDAAWPRSDVDRFLLAALEAKGLQAGRRRRPAARCSAGVTFDLTGLPPTPEEVEAFVADDVARTRSRRWSTACSPRRAFGERWGRHWLDVARYAESSGKTVNFNYPHAWRYRDYVIAAFNADKPYDQFVRSSSPATCCRPRTTAGEGRAR